MHFTKLTFLFIGEYIDQKCDSLNDNFRMKSSGFTACARYSKIIYLLIRLLSLNIL